MNQQSSGQIIQRVTSIVLVLGFFFMPLLQFSLESRNLPTLGFLLTAWDISNGLSVAPLGFFKIHIFDWSSPNGIVWLLVLPAIMGWFVIDAAADIRRRMLSIDAVMVVVALVIMLGTAFSLTAANRDIEKALTDTTGSLSFIPSEFFSIISDRTTQLTLELGYGWWFMLIAYVIMGLNVLRELVSAGSPIVAVARGTVANAAATMASALSATPPATNMNTQPIGTSSNVGSTQTLEQKLERLRKLYESGAISTAEYDATRQQYLDEL
jgi:hydrogenase-4 membrane subunit HyfE